MSANPSTMPRELHEIAAELEALNNGDPEMSHARADELLIEALERLSSYATDTVNENEVTRIIFAWENLRKWYA